MQQTAAALPERTLMISPQVYESIRLTIGSLPAECGGVLGADASGAITHYYFDETGRCTPDSYEPDVDSINEMLLTRWLPEGIHLAGIVHSHADGRPIPSCGDIHYGTRILQAMDGLDRFYLPIVTGMNESAKLTAYALEKDEALGTVCRKQAWKTL